MATNWTQADLEALMAAMAGGVLEIEFDGPPKRRQKFQDLGAMRKLKAEMQSQINGSTGSPAFRYATTQKGFRNG